MAKIVILGAGLAGTLMAYELKPALRSEDELVVVGQGPTYHFVPSNPWVAAGWRSKVDIEVSLPEVMSRKNIRYIDKGGKRLHPEKNFLELTDGTSLPYDYLIIATGPDLAFDEVDGLGPDRFTHSICHVDHAEKASNALKAFIKDPGPIVVGASQGASCFGPAYEFAFILDTELRRQRLRHKVPMTFVTPEPYIGHLGLDGVGDTKGLLESELRKRHIKWIINATIKSVNPQNMLVDQLAEDGKIRASFDLPFSYSMILPAFRGVRAVYGIDGLTNARGFVLVDRGQRNPSFQNTFAIGVCVAIAPTGPTPVPVGVPKTGFMIESMVTAATHNVGALLRGVTPDAEATWNAVCLADFGDRGIAFVAEPQIPPRNVNWSSQGVWVHYAKQAFEKYYLRKMRKGESEPFYERWIIQALGIHRLTRTR